jgi:hypothetical protein
MGGEAAERGEGAGEFVGVGSELLLDLGFEEVSRDVGSGKG